MASGLTTMYFAGRKLWWAWLIGIATEILWSIYSIQTSQPGFLVFAIVYAVIYANNAWKWRSQSRTDFTV